MGGARAKRRRLLTHQPVQIEGVFEARRCGTHGADPCQQQDEGRRRNANKETDRPANAVEIAKGGARGMAAAICRSATWNRLVKWPRRSISWCASDITAALIAWW